MIWLYWFRLHVLCCTTICHYKFILIISLTTEIYKSYTNVSLRIYLTIKKVRCSGRRRTCFFFFKMWVHEGITWILYWFKITLLKHMLTMIWHNYEKHVCLFFYYTDNFERHMTLSFLMSKYLKKFYSFSILFGQFDIQNTVSTTPSMCLTVCTNVQTRFDIIYLHD